MPTAVDFLQDLAIVMIVAGLVTILFHRLRQPVVLGYILAGVLIGPYTPPFPLIQNQDNIQILSQLGVVLLMYSLGLQFSFRNLMRVGSTAFIAATLEVILMVGIGYQVGRLFGWNRMDSLFLGAILLSSSTIIIVKALNDLGLAKQKFAQFIFGILVIDDMFAIAAIALLSSIAMTGSLAVEDVLMTAGRMATFLVAVLVVGLLAVPFLLRYIVRFKNDEVLLVAVLGMAFGVALLALRLGYSVALGAFLIGAIMAETRERGRIETLVAPVRDMFSAIFFVTIGMLFDPNLMLQYWRPVLVVIAVLVLGKIITGSLGAFVAGNDTRTSLRVGMGLAQIGEFAFIIAQLGLVLGVTSEFLYPIAVSVSAVTTLLTPYLIKNSDRFVSVFERLAPNTLLGYLDTYHRWVTGLRQDARPGSQVRKMIRKWLLQVALNMALITAILVTAKWLALWARDVGLDVPSWTGGARTVIWLVAMLATLPLLVATLRKTRAIAHVLAEMSLTRRAAPENRPLLRAAVANAILVPAALAVGVWILAVSAALLPPWPVLVALIVLIVGIMIVRWSTFVKMYARAQIALQSRLSNDHREPEPTPPIPLLQNAIVEAITIASDSPAAGKLIRELALRTVTGASAVGIERDGTSVVNPGPDEELLPGDRVLLLGDPAQLEAARRLLGRAETPHA